MSKIVLSDYQIGDDYKFGNDLLKSLGNEIVQMKTFEDIISSSLLNILGIKNNKVNINKKIEIIYKHLKPFSSINNVDHKNWFLKNILELETLPCDNYQKLYSEANKYLCRITEIIIKYQEELFKYKSDKKQPPLILIDYYDRCIYEQQLIIIFMNSSQIIEKSVKLSKHNNWQLDCYRFPFHFQIDYIIGYFDYDKIDSIRHRLIKTKYYLDGKKIISLYEINKTLFYKRILKEITINQIFIYFHETINKFSFLSNREEIFKELEWLFRKKRYIGFSALAITQIEGLNSDFLELYPNKGNNKDGLVKKIDSIRDEAYFRYWYYDYFKYKFPEIRNNFAHGKVDGSQYNLNFIYDLLFDIRYLLIEFTNLENVKIQVEDLLSRANFTIEDLIEVVNLLYSLNLKDKNNPYRVLLQEKLKIKINEIDINEGVFNSINEKIIKTNEKIRAFTLLDLSVLIKIDDNDLLKINKYKLIYQYEIEDITKVKIFLDNYLNFIDVNKDFKNIINTFKDNNYNIIKVYFQIKYRLKL